MSESYIDIEKFDRMFDRLNALTNPERITILEFLRKKEKASVTEIQAHLNIQLDYVSNHLKRLRVLKIVIAKRSGHNVIYSINHTVVANIIDSINTCS